MLLNYCGDVFLRVWQWKLEIFSGEEDDLLINKTKTNKARKRRKCQFYSKTYTWRQSLHSKLFFGKDSSEILLNYGTNFRKTFTYTWVSVNIVVRKNFSKAWKNKKQPSRGALRKMCSENMQQIYRTPFPKNTSEGLLLKNISLTSAIATILSI